MAKDFEKILGNAVQKQIDRDASRMVEPNTNTNAQPKLATPFPTCRFCNERIFKNLNPQVHAWERHNKAHVNCAMENTKE